MSKEFAYINHELQECPEISGQPNSTFIDMDIYDTSTLALSELTEFLELYSYNDKEAGQVARIALKLLRAAESEIEEFNKIVLKHLGRVSVRRFNHCPECQAAAVAGEVVGVAVQRRDEGGKFADIKPENIGFIPEKNNGASDSVRH